MGTKPVTIIAIESSCDDTSAAVIRDGVILSNIIANQEVHKQYGGVVPELASRAHQQNIVPVVTQALKDAGVDKTEINAVGYTRGPGLLGSLLVGTSFAKSFALALNIPLIEINHMHAHVLALFSKEKNKDYSHPNFPFICLTVSGGHTQLLKVNAPLDIELVGQSLDDAAGEAFDKSAKILGLEYPGGPLIDKYAQRGNPLKFKFPFPKAPDYNYSFSGLKTAILYFIRDETKKNELFIEENLDDICASIQYTIVEILFKKLKAVASDFDIKEVGIVGGVAANSGIRKRLKEEEKNSGWKTYSPSFEYCTDNAAMIGIMAHFKYLNNVFSNQRTTAIPRYPIQSK
ncbi:MAG: tRNA (adenosine(37)-N6)-threonylcarbamoyltransferase complex transferase subunit TsaD [Flavobacteriales bacterium]|nr:tRNA (adenosine(37)-N6)-threonylcarbamoyltransferase complex transferase subunit TsaD [Flavobacteriales bacterium]